ncbi:hypothetical protein F66182_1605 [Fusarium sp. NRRL 66182]|nr:hypothetical protein F66182_1605 [Fusarium sp. NRRL 66182]
MADNKLTVLVIGKGGREHALAWQLSQAKSVRHVFVFTGNAGTEMETNVSNLENLSVDHQELPVDIPCFAPSREAAQLEGSKVFAKSFMQRYSIPTAEHRSFDRLNDAVAYVCSLNHRIVIKADDLAAGKGVVLPETQDDALEELQSIMSDGKFSTAGSSVVIEEYMEGDEISVLTFSDGATFYSLPPGQDNTSAPGKETEGLILEAWESTHLCLL